MKIGVVGLGKLGLPLASLFAQAGHRVIGIEKLEDRNEIINKHKNPIPAEPNIVITQNMFATSDMSKISDCEIIFVAVNTPPLPQGNLSLKDLEEACYEIKSALLGPPAEYPHIIVISSTVPLKTMEQLKEIVSPFPIVYNPFFIALGQVVNDLQYPDIILVGSDDKVAGRRVSGLWADITGGKIPVSETNLRTAELVKFGLTPYLVMRINWANTLARVAEEIGDIDAQEVIDIIGRDKRINTRNLQLGLPWGGDCYPKDVSAFNTFCISNGIEPTFFEGLLKVNEQWKEDLPNFIKDKFCESDFRHKKIAFLGLSYKKTYPLLNMSTPYELYKYFVREEADVVVHDPYIEKFLDEKGREVQTHSLPNCLRKADFVIVAVAYPQYKELTMRDLPYPEVPIVDLCRGLKGTPIASSENWMPLGLRL